MNSIPVTLWSEDHPMYGQAFEPWSLAEALNKLKEQEPIFGEVLPVRHTQHGREIYAKRLMAVEESQVGFCCQNIAFVEDGQGRRITARLTPTGPKKELVEALLQSNQHSFSIRSAAVHYGTWYHVKHLAGFDIRPINDTVDGWMIQTDVQRFKGSDVLIENIKRVQRSDAALYYLAYSLLHSAMIYAWERKVSQVRGEIIHTAGTFPGVFDFNKVDQGEIEIYFPVLGGLVTLKEIEGGYSAPIDNLVTQTVEWFKTLQPA